jgi:hypothetical protein
MGTIANEQILADGDSQFAQAFDLRDERDGIDNNAIANHAGFPAPEYSRRNKVQDVFGAAMNDCMSGIVAALAADHNVGLGREHVDDLPFPFIAPLRTD